jgi:hypothetical protein
MANHAVVIPNKLAAKNIDAYVRPAIAEQDLDNGNVFSLVAKSTTAGEAEVWKAVVPTTGSLGGLWMALEPELPFVKNGTRQYNGLGTIQDFYTSASTVFTAVKLCVGDIITLTTDAIAANPTYTHVIASNGTFLLTGANSSCGATGTLALKYLGTNYIPSADGAIASGRITSYQYSVIVN